MIFNELRQRETANFPVEFYHIDKFHPKYEMAYHWHSEVELIRILEGELRVTLDNREYRAQKGDMIFVNSETVHGAVPEDCIYECIVFSAEYLSVNENMCRTFIENIINHDVYVNEIHHADEYEFAGVMTRLFDSLKARSNGYIFTVTGCLYELFGVILMNNMYSESISMNSIHNSKNVIMLKKVLAYIRKSYDSHVTLDDIANAVGISPKYLCTFFKEMTGKSPFEYLNIYRVERAARKLINTDLPVTQIAYTCGFNDLSYFIKTFKQIKGMTPKNFRKISAVS